MIAAVLIVLSVIFLIVYLIGKNNESYWKKRNVAFYSKHKVTGVMWDFLFNNKSVFENLCEVYKEYRKEPAVGVGSMGSPSLFVIDPTNVQHVLSSDFYSFSSRGVPINDSDVLANSILFVDGNKWRLLRQSMSPLFTSTKLKSMYYIVDKSAVDFVDYLKQSESLRKGNAFDTLSSFCSAAIGAAVFGVSTQSIFDSPFLDMARNAFQEPSMNIKFAIANLNATLFKFLGLNFFKKHETFFINAIKQVLRERERDKVKRYDFADLCVNLQSSGMLVDKDTGLQLEPTDELLAAQAFFFFLAGVEPTASALFATLIQLGLNPDCLHKVHDEIDETFKSCDGKLDYDAVINMKYLDMVINEAMRIFPAIGFLTRQCVRESVLPVGNIKVEVGTNILTPLYQIHHDEKYYPNPEKFDPERFSPENRHKIADVYFMPFGKGNRVCIGARYALLQAKAGLVHLLRNFTVKTKVLDGGIKFSKQTVQVRPDNVDVEFIPRL